MDRESSMSEGEAGEPGPGAVFLSGCEPVRVWFAWHPECEGGADLAQTLAGALGELGGADRAGTGVPTYFATSTDPHEVPLTIPPGGEDDVVIVVSLLDAHFVADPRWRTWLGRQRSDAFEILPVALDNSAYRLDAVRELAYLPYDKANPSRLSRVMLVEIARLLLRERPRLFLSYASADGAPVAQALRDAVARYPRIDFFLDEDALAAGEDFPAALRRALDVQVPAMLVIHTDRYGTRPWCRRELATFRRPTEAEPRVWHLRVLLVVDHIQCGVARVLGELAGAPLLRYTASNERQILDRLVQGLALSEYHRRRAQRVMLHTRDNPRRVAIDWVPDAHTMAELTRALDAPPTMVCFPGSGLSRMELEAIRAANAPQAIETFDSVLEAKAGVRARPRTVVGLSFGMPSEDDLTARGLGQSHLSAFLDRMARLLIGHGLDVSFGGAIETGFTYALSTTLRSHVHAEDALMERRPEIGRLPGHPLLVNFGREADDITPGVVAEALGLVRFVEPVDEAQQWHEAFARSLPAVSLDGLGPVRPLVAMRWAMNGPNTAVDGIAVEAPIARILLGGKTSDYAGVLPGVVEEALYARARGVPLFIVGLLGGAARAVGELVWGGLTGAPLFERQSTDVLLDETDQDDDCDYDPGVDSSLLYEIDHQQRSETLERFRRATSLLPGASSDNGLTADENRRLFEARDLDTVIHLLSKGLTALLERSGRRADHC